MFDNLMHFTYNDITITDIVVIDRENAVSQEYGLCLLNGIIKNIILKLDKL